jgi:hypothetical protein
MRTRTAERSWPESTRFMNELGGRSFCSKWALGESDATGAARSITPTVPLLEMVDGADIHTKGRWGDDFNM